MLFLQRFRDIKLKSYQFILLVSTLQFFLFSFPFIRGVWSAKGDYGLLGSLALLGFLITNLLCSLLISKLTRKFIIFLLFITSAVSLYFINSYGVFIDKFMIINIIESNTREAYELLNYRLFSYILIFGIIPSYLLLQITVIYSSFSKELLYKFAMILVNLVCVALIIIASSKFLPFARQHKPLRHLLIPVNYVAALIDYGILLGKNSNNSVLAPIAEDAEKIDIPENRKKLVIFIVGEAARAKNFSFNGYYRNTNELLKYDVINFTNFYSCGTATATSVPCIFSHLDRKNFDISKGKKHQNLLDILSAVGVNVTWIDNDFGCKGVCQRVTNIEMSCENGNCYDELMLKELSKNIRSDQDNLIILHQLGSHGPAYYLRVPEHLKKFSPVCNTGNLDECTKDEIVGSYDNTIYYTSYFINEVIKFASEYEKHMDSAVIYVSDHGESLGENGLYLHGVPYIIAPDEQIHIPSIFWFSKAFIKANNIEYQCIAAKKDQEFSHDYIFHTMLRLFNIKTQIYDKELDMLKGC